MQDVQRVCDQVIQRFDGWMAQHFGDGFVVYFGYPRAHEDNARRAAHTAWRSWEHGAAVAGVQETARCGIYRTGGDSHGHSGAQRPWQW